MSWDSDDEVPQAVFNIPVGATQKLNSNSQSSVSFDENGDPIILCLLTPNRVKSVHSQTILTFHCMWRGKILSTLTEQSIEILKSFEAEPFSRDQGTQTVCHLVRLDDLKDIG